MTGMKQRFPCLKMPIKVCYNKSAEVILIGRAAEESAALVFYLDEHRSDNDCERKQER